MLVASGSAAGAAGMGSMLIWLVAMVAMFYFLLIRPQKKRDKETARMRANLEVGDEIVTVGGIIGTVVVIKDDHLIIETGSDRSKVRITRWAAQANNTPHEVPTTKK